MTFTPHPFAGPVTAAAFNSRYTELEAAIDLLATAGLIDAATTLQAQANSGQKVLDTVVTTGFVVGDAVWIGTAGSGLQEMGVIFSISAGVSLTLVANLANTHAIGAPVSRSPAEIVNARGTFATLGARVSLAEGRVFDVARYGAVGNGTADDTSAIAATISAAGVGGRVYIPDGTFKISTALVPLSGQTLFGTGHRSILKRADSFNSYLINAGSDSTDITFSDITLDGNRAGTTGSTYLVFAVRPLRWRVERTRFINTPATAPALALQGGDDNVIANCHFEDVGYGVVIGVTPDSVDSCNRNIVTGCTFRDVDLNGIFFTGSLDSTASTSTPRGNVAIGNTLLACGDAAIESGIGCRDTVIQGNTVRGGTVGLTGILVRDNVGTTVDGNAVSSIRGTNGDGIAVISQHTESTGIVIGPNVSGGNVRNGLFVQEAFRVSISGGDYSDNDNRGVTLEGVTEFTMKGVLAASNDGAGFAIGDTGLATSAGVVSACVAYNNSAATPNTQDGFITVNAGTANIHFADNMAFDTRTGTNRTQRYGFQFWQGAVSISAAGNKAFNNRTGEIADTVGVQGVNFSNVASASSLGSVIRKVEIFTADGVSMGFIPVYNTIT